MIRLLQFVSCLIVTVSSSVALTSQAADSTDGGNDGSQRPNIVLLVADDLGYGELGCQGNPQIPTPHIDSIAGSGVRFTNGYVTAPYCSASRAGLMTGKYQNRFGYEFNPVGAFNEDAEAGLPVGERTLGDHLHDAGYATGLIGKWHLGGTAKYHPYRRGFDEFFGFLHEGHYFVPPPYRGVTTMLRRRTLPTGDKGRWTSRNGRLVLSTHMGYDEPDYDADNPIYRGGQPVEEHEYLTDALTREAVEFIDRNAERPFFLYLAYNAVHSPLQGADAYMKKFVGIDDIHRRIFAAMLSNLDDSVGSVLQALRERRLEENTLVFFISDNGGPTRELTSSNAPLRGEKGQVYEGGIRVPFLMQWKGRVPAGVEFQQPVISLDIFATASQVATGRIPRSSDGVDILPHVADDTSAAPHSELFWRIGRRTAVRVGDWKLLRNPVGRAASDNWELYNLANDLEEEHDLAATEPERVQQLEAVWKRFNVQMIDPVWSPRR